MNFMSRIPLTGPHRHAPPHLHFKQRRCSVTKSPYRVSILSSLQFLSPRPYAIRKCCDLSLQNKTWFCHNLSISTGSMLVWVTTISTFLVGIRASKLNSTHHSLILKSASAFEIYRSSPILHLVRVYQTGRQGPDTPPSWACILHPPPPSVGHTVSFSRWRLHRLNTDYAFTCLLIYHLSPSLAQKSSSVKTDSGLVPFLFLVYSY